MSNAGLDQNSRQTLTALSSVDGVTIVPLYANPTTHRLLVDSAAAAGTVTSVSVVSANGFAGTVATATTTPAITISTSITGLLKGNGTAISAATDGTDYLSSTTGLKLDQTSSQTIINGQPIWNTLTASQAIVTDASKKFASLGYSSTPTSSFLVQRDANANSSANNFITSLSSTVSASGTTILTVGSSKTQVLTGTLSQTFQLPDATTLALSTSFLFDNNSSSSLIITNAGAATLYTIPAGGVVECVVTNIGTANGTWDFHAFAPGTATWGTGVTGLVFNTALTTTPSINAGISSAAAPSFIPQRGSATTGFGGDSTNLYLSIGGASKFSVGSTGHITVEGVTSTGATGTGLLVFGTSPTLTTPTLGVATATTINGNTFTTGSYTLTGTAAKTLNFTNTLTLSGTDSTTMTFPTTSATIARTDAAQTFTGTQTFSQQVMTNNAITATANAATVPITSRISTVTNNSAATLTITITTTSAVDGMLVQVRVLDFSAVAQTITWINTENGEGTAPTTSNGSTTLPRAALFQFNSGSSKWRCIAS